MSLLLALQKKIIAKDEDRRKEESSTALKFY